MEDRRPEDELLEAESNTFDDVCGENSDVNCQLQGPALATAKTSAQKENVAKAQNLSEMSASAQSDADLRENIKNKTVVSQALQNIETAGETRENVKKSGDAVDPDANPNENVGTPAQAQASAQKKASNSTPTPASVSRFFKAASPKNLASATWKLAGHLYPKSRKIRVSAPAKINLALRVGGRQENGYHDLNTIFFALDFGSFLDAYLRAAGKTLIRVRRHPHPRLNMTRRELDVVPVDSRNLAWKAADLLRKECNVNYGCELHLRKQIPVAGGMAGGSADAAATLVALNELWQLEIGQEKLLELASQLGSDVPFSLLGGAAHGTGRGEKLAPVSCQQLYWCVVMLPVHLSTPEVFKLFDQLQPPTLDLDLPPMSQLPAPAFPSGWQQLLEDAPVSELTPLLINDLEPAACKLQPMVAQTLRQLRHLGALTALVSGSGPTCLGLGQDLAHAQFLAQAVNRSNLPGIRAAVATGPAPGASLL